MINIMDLIKALVFIAAHNNVEVSQISAIEYEDGSKYRFNYKLEGQACYIDMSKLKGIVFDWNTPL